jgi:pimeloyl-ACP methyl ester carboxylesterase
VALLDSAALDVLRQQMDPEADRLAEHYLTRPPSDMFKGVMAARYAGTDMSDPHVAAWIEDRPPLPAWADPDRMDRGAAFFAEWGVELGLGLFLSSLPLAYAAHDGVQVLALTAQLETNTKRRVLESAQFVLDVTTPGGLFPGNEPYDTVRLVRLMHAGVRNLVLTDPRIERTSDESVWPRWDETWGAPINQEHLLGAMISYSSSLLHVLDRLHVDYDAAGASDYCHLWNVVGWLLGIDPVVLPLERAEMDDLELLIRERNERWSQAGKDMTKALLELVQSFIRIPPLRGLAVSTTRVFIGDDTAKVLEVPPADWTRHLVGGMRTMSGRASWLVAHDRVVRALASGFSRRVLTGFVTHERHGARPSFTVPDHLAFAFTPGPSALVERTTAAFRRDPDRYRAAEQRLWRSLGVTPTESTVRLARTGVNVRLQEVGEGTPVVFVHGASNAGTSWASLAALLGDFRCVLLDRPGCGLSDPLPQSLDDAARLAAFADDLVVDVLDALTVERAALVGTSFGGYFTLRAAAAHPERVSRVLQLGWTVGAPSHKVPTVMRAAAVPGVGRALASVPPNERATRSMLGQIGLDDAVATGTMTPEMVEVFHSLLRDTRTLRNELEASPRVVLPIKGMNTELLLPADLLAKIAAPTYFLWGTRDPFGDESTARQLASMIPNAQVEMMPGGHAVWIDNPAYVAKVAESFLAG